MTTDDRHEHVPEAKLYVVWAMLKVTMGLEDEILTQSQF